MGGAYGPQFVKLLRFRADLVRFGRTCAYAAQQFLGGDEVPTRVCMYGIEVGIYFPKRGVENIPDGTKRARSRHKVFASIDRELRFLHHISTAHRICPQKMHRFLRPSYLPLLEGEIQQTAGR